MFGIKGLKQHTANLNILYAEDNEFVRDSMQAILSKLFKNTYLATNGQEAFEILGKEDIDLIITDISMPIMNGTELIENIQTFTDKEFPIIILSADNESELLTKLINLGVNNFLSKPLDAKLMIDFLYKTCKIINDKKLMLKYEIETMEEKNIALIEMKKKNIMLEVEYMLYKI